jgi:hypothetical protein
MVEGFKHAGLFLNFKTSFPGRRQRRFDERDEKPSRQRRKRLVGVAVDDRVRLVQVSTLFFFFVNDAPYN